MAAPKKILAFGDSLTAGYGLPEDKSFAAQLEQKLRENGHDIIVINGGVSGDTTAGGLARLEWALQDNPDFVILELGANDMLRGVRPDVTRKNLEAMLKILTDREKPVLLAGMKSFVNLGPLYGGAFNSLFKDLSKKYKTHFYPFFLEGVAGVSHLNLEDGLHPNAAGVAAIVEGIYPQVEALISGKKPKSGWLF